MRRLALRLIPAALLALLTGCPHQTVRITIQLNGCPLNFALHPNVESPPLKRVNPPGEPVAIYDVLPGAGYVLRNGQGIADNNEGESIVLDVPATGPVVVRSPTFSATADGRTIRLNTKDVLLDPAAYGESGNTLTIHQQPNPLPVSSTSQVVRLVAGMAYQCDNGLSNGNNGMRSYMVFIIGEKGIPITIDPAAAAVGKPPEGQPKVDGILRLNWLTIEVRPPDDTVRYYVGNSGSRSYSGTQSVVVPNELRARIGVVGNSEDYEDFLVHASDTGDHTQTTTVSHTVFHWRVVGPAPK